MNWLSDMDWGWWPMLAFRPPKDQDIDTRVLLKISPVFGILSGLLALMICATRNPEAATPRNVVACLSGGVAVFFIGYKVTFAYFWNRRARRLRSLQAKEAPAPRA